MDINISKHIQGEVTLFKLERLVVKSTFIVAAIAYNIDMKSSLFLHYEYLQLP